MTSFVTQSDIQLSGPGLIGSDVLGASPRRSKRILIGAGLSLVDGELVNTLDLSAYLTAETAAETYLPLSGGTLTGDLKFTDATYDIGKSGVTRPRDGFFSRNVVIGGVASINNSGLSARYSLNVGTSSFAGLVDSEVVAGFYNAVFSSNNARVSVICGSGGEASLYLGDYATTRVKLTSASAGVLEQRDGTNAQTFRLAETWTSTTSFGAFQIKANAGAAYQIGSAKGSAGGNNQALSFGHWDAAGTFASNLTVNTESGYVNVGQTTFRYNAVWNTSVYGVVLRTSNPFMTLWAGDAQNVFGSSFSGYGVVAIGPDISANSGYGLTTYDKLIFYTNGANGHSTVCIGNVGSLSGTDTTLATTNTPNSGEFTVTAGQGTNKVGGNLWLVGGRSTGNASGGSVYIGVSPPGASGTTRNARFTVAEFSTTGAVLTQPVSASGSPTAFTITGAAHTTLTASAEATDINFNLARTVQFATGALTTQRAFRVQAPTYSFVGASTITTASTLSISGPPAAGTNATITNAYALNVESGKTFLQGGLIAYGDVELGGNTALVSQSGAFTATFGSGFFGWIEGGYITYGTTASSVITRLYRDAAGIVAQRNSTNAQMLRVYNTYTSSTSYEAGVLDWQTEANVLCFGTVKGSGGGSARQLKIVTDGTAALTISTAQAITASSTLTAVGTITSQGSISNDRYAATPLIRVRRAGGTSSSPTQVTTAQTIGIIGSYGYHDGGAFHSNTGASIQFISTEDYTATAQGTEIRFATADAGSTSATTRLTIEDNGVFSFQKLVGQETEVTGTPSGTTQTLTMNNGNHQTLALTSSTGNVTVTLTVPDRSSAGTFIVKQHGSTPRDITWAVSSGTIKWMGTEPTWNGDAASAVRIVSWRWNGSVMYLMSTDVAA